MRERDQRDPLEYAARESSLESEVLYFAHEMGCIVLDIDYVWEFEEWPTDYGEFRRLIFHGVTSLTQTQTRTYGALHSEFRATRMNRRTYSVTHEKFSRCGTDFRAEYCFSDLGCFEFDFESLVVEKKPVRATTKVGDEWIYVDPQGRPVNNYSPFDEEK